MDFAVEKEKGENYLDMDVFSISVRKKGNRYQIQIDVQVDSKPVKNKQANFLTKTTTNHVIDLTDFFTSMGFKTLKTYVVPNGKAGSGFPIIYKYPAVFTLPAKVLKELKEASKKALKEGEVARTPLTGFYGGAIYGEDFKKRKGHVIFKAIEVYSSPEPIPKEASLWITANGSFTKKKAFENLWNFLSSACVWYRIPHNDAILEKTINELLE